MKLKIEIDVDEINCQYIEQALLDKIFGKNCSSLLSANFTENIKEYIDDRLREELIEEGGTTENMHILSYIKSKCTFANKDGSEPIQITVE